MRLLAMRFLAFVRTQDWRTLVYSFGSWFVLTYAFVGAFKIYAFGFESSIIGQHDFRQTQTAFSAFTIAHGGPWFAYETPLFGAPYAIPFEFPVYQWIVALVNRGGVPLDQAGRYVSIGFFLLSLLPFYRLLRRFSFSLNASLLTLAMFVSAPLYTFWTRAFMIESTALCFALGALCVGEEALHNLNCRQRRALLFALASLAMLVKVTTGMVYLGFLALLLLGRFFQENNKRATFKAYAVFALCGLVAPTLLTLIWTHYTDALKADNALTASFLTSAPLSDWYFGTWQQKLSLQTWILLWDRTTWYGFGTAVSLVAGLALAVFGSQKPWLVTVCLLSIFGAFATFTNLHAFHDYYQYATTALAIVLVGFGFVAAERWTPRARLLLPVFGAAIVFRSFAAYDADYRQLQIAADVRVLDVGKFIRSHTHNTALIVVFGYDWSSVLPYYARRKALLNRWNHPANHPDIQRTLERSLAHGNPVEAVLFCNADRAFTDGRADTFLQHQATCTPIGNCDVCL